MFKKALIALVAIPVIIIIIIAIIPQRDCDGNATWKTSETCTTGK